VERETIAITLRHIQYALFAELALFCPVFVYFGLGVGLIPTSGILVMTFRGEDGLTFYLLPAIPAAFYLFLLFFVSKGVCAFVSKCVPRSITGVVCAAVLLFPPVVTFFPVYGFWGIRGGNGPMSLWRLLIQ
jgi:hypothetical protein